MEDIIHIKYNLAEAQISDDISECMSTIGYKKIDQKPFSNWLSVYSNAQEVMF